MQLIWMTGLDWDDKLPEGIHAKALQWVQESLELERVRIPRCLIEEQNSNWSLHVFSDASELAYGAVVYLREEIENTVKTRIVVAKSKVAPVKVISIPRLELLGACMGVAMVKRIVKVLNYATRDVTFWTDSMDVLY